MNSTYFKALLRYVIKESMAIILFLPNLIFLKIKFGNKKVLFVLNYHNFSRYSNFRIKQGSMLERGYSKNFEKQMTFLNKYFNFCYPEDFFSEKSPNGIHILITFDDGYKDNFDIAAPILIKHKIPTIFFVSTKFIDTNDFIMHDILKYLIEKGLITKDYLICLKKLNNGISNYSKEDIKKLKSIFEKHPPEGRLMMSSEELVELQKNEFLIGNHTFNHDGLLFYEKKEQYETIHKANDFLEEVLGVGLGHIAFPNGLFNNDTLELMDSLNLKYGYTVNGGYNLVNDNKKELKRIGINASDSIYLIVLKLVAYSTFKYEKS